MSIIFSAYDDDNPMREWHHGQFMVNHHQRVVEPAASHRIALNVHEGVKDTGLRRTWPNRRGGVRHGIPGKGD